MANMTLDAFLTHCHEKGYFNGTWLLKKQGKIISKGAVGKAHPYEERPLAVDTVFEIASVSKHFTATAIMILRDRGQLSLDDPLEKYIPGVPYPGITVKNLLNHTSGLPDYMDWIAQLGTRDSKIYPNGIIERFLLESGMERLFEPGEGWSYCNTAYSTLALIVEKVSGKSFTDFMQREIFTPCGMTSSCVYHRRMNGASIANYAYGMVLTGEGYKLPDDTPEHNYVIPLDGMEGDGIVNTTVEDMAKWDEAQRKGTVLSLASQQEMYTETRIKNGEEFPYGYGWRRVHDPAGEAVQHGGGWPGYNTTFLRLLEEDTMVAVFCNQTGCDGLARSEVWEGVADIAFGRQPRLPRTLAEYEDKTVDPAAFPPLCGEYEDNVSVYLKDGSLWLKLYYREQNIDSQLVPIGVGQFISRTANLRITLDGKTVLARLMDKPVTYKRV